jgi:hypothetical protein
MLAACATSGSAIERLKDGSYRLECRGTLSNCLVQAEKPCASYGYEVLSGRQETRVFGPEQVQSKYVSSEAIVMCRNANGWFDDREQPAREAQTSDAPPPPRTKACIPGASQSCTGPGGCKGGQTCAPDGLAYLPCDCGEAEATPATPNTSAPLSAGPSDPSGMPASVTSEPLPSPSSAAPEPANTGVTPPTAR